MDPSQKTVSLRKCLNIKKINNFTCFLSALIIGIIKEVHKALKLKKQVEAQKSTISQRINVFIDLQIL